MTLPGSAPLSTYWRSAGAAAAVIIATTVLGACTRSTPSGEAPDAPESEPEPCAEALENAEALGRPALEAQLKSLRAAVRADARTYWERRLSRRMFISTCEASVANKEVARCLAAAKSAEAFRQCAGPVKAEGKSDAWPPDFDLTGCERALLNVRGLSRETQEKGLGGTGRKGERDALAQVQSAWFERAFLERCRELDASAARCAAKTRSLYELEACGGKLPEPAAATSPPSPPLPPPLATSVFPCSQCHEPPDINRKPRKLELEHAKLVVRHGPMRRWCFECHDAENYDKLKLADGRRVPYSQSHLQCGQCHAITYRDWLLARHGRIVGPKGAVSYVSCLRCHDAHAPKVARPFRQWWPQQPGLLGR